MVDDSVRAKKKKQQLMRTKPMTNNRNTIKRTIYFA